MNKVHVKTGDEVVVINGKYHGQKGKVLAVSPAEGKVIVEGVAMVKKHQKPRGQGLPGGIIDKEAPIPACKVMLVCPLCKKATRVAHTFLEKDGKQVKVRFCTSCKKAIEG